jgi:Ca2+-binding RTX toxin-like protein
MTIKETYTGLLDQQELGVAFGFLFSDPKAKIDKKHNTITFSDPNNAHNKIVADTKHLDVKNGQITDGVITDYHMISNGKDAVTVTGLDLDATGLQPALMNGGSGIYQYIADNIHGAIIATGDKFNNFLEVGEGGKGSVNAGDGNDAIQIWHAKNVAIDGGKGIDTIEFDSFTGVSTMPIETGVAKVDLAHGTGTNPFGGTITVKNVEILYNMNGASDFRGDGKDNTFFTGSAASTLIGGGGDDQLHVWVNTSADPRATLADGGTGKDTLYAELSEGLAAPQSGTGDSLRFLNKLDVEHAGQNTGTFHGGTFKHFEIFRVNGFVNKDIFDFSGSNANEQVYSAGSDDPLDGRGGDDLLFGGQGADRLTGGTGADTFQYSATTDSVANPTLRDTIVDFTQSQHDKIDLHLIDANSTGGTANDKFKFMNGHAFDGHAGEVTFETTETSTFVYADTDGNKSPDMVILLDGVINLTKNDFIL